MKQKILAGTGIAALMAFLVGCGEIKFGGTLDIHEPMTVVQEGQDPYECNQQIEWWNCKPAKTVVLNPGQFTAKVTLGMDNQRKQIKLEVNNANPPTTVDINFDKSIEIGEHFTLAAAQIKQNFDLNGDIATKVERTAEQSGTESCTYQVPEMVCRGAAAAGNADAGISIETVEADIAKFGPYPGGPGDFPYPGSMPPVPYPGYYPGPYPGPNPVPVCHTVWVNRPGYMYVRYYYETTLRDIAARFVQGGKNLADYQGHASNTETIYTYRSECR